MTTFLPAFTALFVVVEPFGVVPTFVALTTRRTRDESARIALRASLVGAAVLVGFALVGRQTLDALGVRLEAFRMAGGLLLLLTALDMLRGRPSACRCSEDDEKADGDVAVVPIAIPLLAGPGSMATILLLLSPASGAPTPLWEVLLAIALTFAITFGVLRAARRLDTLMGPSVVSVVQRVLGLVLAAMALQTVLEGARPFLPS